MTVSWNGFTQTGELINFQIFICKKKKSKATMISNTVVMTTRKIVMKVFVCRSGVRLNFTASTTGNTLTGFSALAHMEFHLLFVRSK